MKGARKDRLQPMPEGHIYLISRGLHYGALVW